jgi:CheY-like chemotaxis protein
MLHPPTAAIPPLLPRILVVDDQFDVALSIARTLRLAATVDFEREPARVLERLRDGERFDLIVSDVQMPEMNGPDLFDRIAAEAPAMCAVFVFVSGGMEPPLAARVTATGRPCLEKPVGGDELLALVRRPSSPPLSP